MVFLTLNMVTNALSAAVRIISIFLCELEIGCNYGVAIAISGLM